MNDQNNNDSLLAVAFVALGLLPVGAMIYSKLKDNSAKSTFDQGKAAFHAGLLVSDNPYMPDSQKSSLWFAGYGQEYWKAEHERRAAQARADQANWYT